MSKFSIPDFSVRVDEGHPLHAPFNDTVTLPLLNDSKSIAPPSCSTAGFIYSSKIFLIFSSILFDSDFDSDFTDEKCNSGVKSEPVPFRPQDRECRRVHNYT